MEELEGLEPHLWVVLGSGEVTGGEGSAVAGGHRRFCTVAALLRRPWVVESGPVCFREPRGCGSGAGLGWRRHGARGSTASRRQRGLYAAAAARWRHRGGAVGIGRFSSRRRS